MVRPSSPSVSATQPPTVYRLGVGIPDGEWTLYLESATAGETVESRSQDADSLCVAHSVTFRSWIFAVPSTSTTGPPLYLRLYQLMVRQTLAYSATIVASSGSDAGVETSHYCTTPTLSARISCWQRG